MRGEYTYYAHGSEFARERFTLNEETTGQVTLRSRVSGTGIKLFMNMEMQFAPNGCPLHLSLLCEYAGAKGSADYLVTNNGIKARVRSGGIERYLHSQAANVDVVIPQTICAYRQFALLTRNCVEVPICWVDVYDATAFLRPRLRHVTVYRSDRRYVQTTPACTFTDLTQVTIVDSAAAHPISGEGYLGPAGIPVLWRENNNYEYVLTAFVP